MKFFIFFFPLLLFAQPKTTPKAIDERLKKSNFLLVDGKTDDMIALNQSVLKDAKSINYAKGRLYAYYNLALAFSMQYKYSKSNYYLKLMEPELKYMDDGSQEIAMNVVYSMNYRGIKMYDEALKKLKKNLIPADNIKNDSARYSLKGILLTQITRNYIEKKNYDSATYYGKSVIQEFKRAKKMDIGLNTNLKIVTLLLGEAKINQNKTDSAEFYVKSAQSVPIKLGNNEFAAFKLLGQIHDARKQYDSAIVDYKKAIELAAKIKNFRKLAELYGLISTVYEKTGQTDNQKKYELKYNALNDSLKTVDENNLKDTVGVLVEEKQKPLEDKNNLLLYIILAGIAGTAVIVFFVYKRIKNNDKVLNVKEQETQKLNQQLNVAFEEVIQLAKKNDPEFLARFQEVYPELFPKLLKIEPQLMNTELKFCALLFLNFSTKDIAAYTFVQPQSIQTRKNRLRKRLNITSDEDIYIWMKNL
ncbi:tetratricopeptide repeat protein [Chryseobacterium shigense]|uniref:Tetratricopeptide (TPR) repeat protein n=1 Tax=Chryseobacterium shigense TaxID=297244 RepID=A0A841N9V1_9FLAO|nr:tetratricopeptide repeat protein [Chryseobacterium shigense]MBB6370378.1 tetratricopeptide (TPR) repeat protein [Chryseobacterium shigense]